MSSKFQFSFILLLLLTTCHAQSDRCKTSAVFTYGKCPGECKGYSEAFHSCAPLRQFGCDMKLCGSSPLSFSCELKKDFPIDTLCAGDKIIFDGLDLSKNDTLDYFVDLNAPHLKLDVYLLADDTGSMSGAVAAVKTKFKNIVDSFSDYKDIHFGLGYYRDEAEAGLDNGFRNEQSLTDDTNKVQLAINKLVAKGGGDGPEANLVALYKVATDSSIGWRTGSRKVLVYFGDWPGHEPSCVPGLPELNRHIVGDVLKKKTITVVAVSFTTPGLDSIGFPDDPITSYECAKPAAGSGQASDIVSMTSGEIVSETDQTKLIEAIEEGFNGLEKIFDYDNSDCIAKINDVHDPKLPLSVKAGESSTVKHTLTLKRDICRGPAEFECKYRYFERGAEIPPTTLKFVNIKGC